MAPSYLQYHDCKLPTTSVEYSEQAGSPCSFSLLSNPNKRSISNWKKRDVVKFKKLPIHHFVSRKTKHVQNYPRGGLNTTN